MAGRKEHEMLFQLNAQLSGSFNSTFSKGQQQLLSLQKELQALNKIQADISAYQKQQNAVEATRGKLAVLQQQYDNIQREMKETGSESSALENRLLAKQKQIDKTTASLERETNKLNQMDSALKNAGVNTANLSRESASLASKMDGIKAKQVEAANSAVSFGEKSSQAFGVVQQAIATAGVAVSLKEIYDGYKECVTVAADFEETMSTVEALSGASNGEMRQLNGLAKELGATTKFTAKESGEAMTYMGMAGWEASEMMQGMDGVLQLAAASGEDLARVSDIVTDNLTAFGLKASDTARFSDVLASAATKSNTSVGLMGETFKYAAPTAGALGYKVEDVAVAVGLMANSGIKASIAGTSLKNIFNGLLDGVTLTGKAIGEVEFSALNADGTMKGFGGTVDELRGYFSKLTEAEKVNNAINIAGMRGFNGLLAILNATQEDYDSLYDSINNCSGAASKMAAIKLDNLNGQITLMNSAQDALKTSIGEQFNPELRKLYAVETDIFTMLNKFVQNHPGLVKAVMAFTGVVGVATAGLTGYAAVAKVVKTLELASLFSAGAPVMAAVAGIAAVTAGIVGIVGAYNDAREAARRYGDEITAAADEYKKAMSESEELESYISDWKELNSIISSGAAPAEEVTAAKNRLKETEQWLIDNYGIYLNNDGTISEDEIKSLEDRNEELRETARLKAEIALYDSKEKYDNAKDDIDDTQAKYDKVSTDTLQLAKEQSILSRYSASWQRTVNSNEYKNASAAEQSAMYQKAIGSMNADLQKEGINSDYSGAGFAGVETSLMSLGKQIEKNQAKLNKYKQELLEYNESAIAYKQASRDIIELNLSDIPTDNLQSFAMAAREIGIQAAGAELEAAELERYAEQLTEIAHAAGLLPEEQKIIFNADGALNVIEELADGISELDGKTAEIIADANADAAYMKINNVRYKVLQYDETTGVATLSADGTNATAQIDIVTGQVHMFDEEEAEAYLNANISDFTSNITSAKTLLSSIKDKTVTITSTFKSVYENVKSALGFGSGYATGTTNATPGWHMTGENGPELIYFGGGETVYNAADTKRIMDGSLAQMQVISAMAREPLSAKTDGYGGQYNIKIAPQFVVEGGGSEDIESRLREFSDIIVGNVMDALEESGVNAKRGAYA